MKSIAVFLVPVLLSMTVAAQPCLPEGIVFNTQAQVDNFSTNYPGCTRIEGDVLISGYTICNLIGLNMLTSIGGDLKIESNEALSNTNGLNSLTRIDGDFYLYGNLTMTCLSGLEHLVSIGGDLSMVNNPSMNCMNGLQGLQSIGGTLWIDDNDALLNLSGLDNLTGVGGTIRIYSNDCMTSLNGLNSLLVTGGSLVIGGIGHLGGLGNNMLTDLSALAALASIGGNLEIGFNPAMTDLSGLQNIDPLSIGELRIFNNDNLTGCAIQSICVYLTLPGATTFIADNAPGCNSMAEVSEACELLGFTELPMKPGVTIFPNPATGMITLELTNLQIPSELIVISSLGKVVISRELNFSVSNLDVRSVPPGTYMCLVRNGVAYSTATFIKQ